jgi:hypothetical protein
MKLKYPTPYAKWCALPSTKKTIKMLMKDIFDIQLKLDL